MRTWSSSAYPWCKGGATCRAMQRCSPPSCAALHFCPWWKGIKARSTVPRQVAADVDRHISFPTARCPRLPGAVRCSHVPHEDEPRPAFDAHHRTPIDTTATDDVDAAKWLCARSKGAPTARRRAHVLPLPDHAEACEKWRCGELGDQQGCNRLGKFWQGRRGQLAGACAIHIYYIRECWPCLTRRDLRSIPYISTASGWWIGSTLRSLHSKMSTRPWVRPFHGPLQGSVTRRGRRVRRIQVGNSRN